ncbi:hypothetical protein [Anaeroglobus geminatus]|uniref:Uncharacterized protein n=1 Tax=Anaeroglobus geminatus F0357 TaxID=861450 RepID=G9YK16_9FIRM|nr:hypothetical protein [Anaeroglobus geminatus]EHM37841.1 hypothetical protein HMPREF0080_02025 [Anaeroglobus geminatus F0357]
MNELTITQLQKLGYVLPYFQLPGKRLQPVVMQEGRLLTGSFYDKNIAPCGAIVGSASDVLEFVCRQISPYDPFGVDVANRVPEIFVVLNSDAFVKKLDESIHCRPGVLPPLLYGAKFLESGVTLPFYGFSAEETLPLVSLLLEAE